MGLNGLLDGSGEHGHAASARQRVKLPNRSKALNFITPPFFCAQAEQGRDKKGLARVASPRRSYHVVPRNL